MSLPAMQPIFSNNDDVDKTAYINWRMSQGSDIQNMLNLADGFLLSAIHLAKQCLLDNIHKQADILIFPMLANANHGIELYLKGIVWILNELTHSPYKIEGGHNIQQIYSTVAAKIRSYGGHLSAKDFSEATQELKFYLDELFEQMQPNRRNDKMDFSRYPFSKDYEDHVYVAAIGNVCIDLENFVARFTAIHEKLDQITSFLYYQEFREEL
jgi:hypothetical protein